MTQLWWCGIHAAGNAAPLCGNKYFSQNAINGPDILMPVVREVRYCSGVCVCDAEYEERFLSCNPDDDGSYTYLDGCGTPAKLIEDEADTRFLSGAKIKFTPVPGSDGTFFTTCKSSFAYEGPGDLPYRYTGSGVYSLRNYMSRWRSVTVSLPVKFNFYDWYSGSTKAYRRVTVHPNGYLTFAKHFRRARYDYSLDGHFDWARGPAILGLNTALAMDYCGFDDCGDVRLFAGFVGEVGTADRRPATVITYLNIPYSFADVDEPSVRSTFQIVLANDGSGEFELVYGHVSPLVQGAATYGVSMAEDFVPYSITDPKNSLQCAL